MNNKGFAITGILYSILVLFIVIAALLIFNLQNKKVILDKIKLDTMEYIDGVLNGNIKISSRYTHKGIVYLDPTDLTKTCNDSNSVSTVETKTGCMKWYIFDDSGDNYTMILDHNTTKGTTWNDEGTNVPYESSKVKTVVDDLVTTSGWKVKPRIISAKEVATITKHDSFDPATGYPFYLEDLIYTNNEATSNYDWIYNNLSGCKGHGCSDDSNGNGTEGYWVSDILGRNNTDAWFVFNYGTLTVTSVKSSFGIRPVISVPKYIINTSTYSYDVGKEFTFDYTGYEQVFKPSVAGRYKVELWGAQGERITNNNSQGAYVSGEITLSKDTNLFIYVGQKGNKNLTQAYNGGGAGAQSYDDGNGIHKGSSGGGATDIRLTKGAWNDASSLRSRIIVAGAGGGSYIYTSEAPSSTFPGERSNAGGLTGYSGSSHTYHPDLKGAGGTQIAGGAAGTPYDSPGTVQAGAFGYGGSTSSWSGDEPASGGGGGYYGGGSGAGCSGNAKIGPSGGNGGGGSSYISGHTGCVAITSATNQSPKSGCTTGTTNNSCSIHYSNIKFTNTKMIDGDGYKWTNTKGALEQMPKPTGGYYASGVGHTGNGYVKITYLGN